MKLEGTHVFDAPRAVVYETLLDPDVLARALPGAEGLQRVSETEYRGMMKVGVGPVSAGKYDLTVKIVDPNPPASYRMEIDGRGGLGFARGVATITLEEEGGPDRTRMTYASDLSIGGRIAGVGQRLIDQVAKAKSKEGLEALAREIRARTAG